MSIGKPEGEKTHHSNQSRPRVCRVSTGAARRRPLILLLACALLFLLGVSSAAAEQPHAFLSAFGSPGSEAGQFAFTSESGVAVDQSNGDVYVADTGNHRVEKFSPTGAFLFAFGWGVKTGDTAATGLDQCTSAPPGCQAGFPGHEPGQFEEPTFLAVDNTPHGEGDVYVANNGAVGNERQTVTVSGATGGSFTLSFTDVIHGTTSNGSNLVTNVWGPTHTLKSGEGISGPGIPLGTTIAGTGGLFEGILELSADAIATAASVELGVTGTSSSIKSGASASEVQSALEHLEVLEGNISVSGNAGGPYTVEFINRLADVNVRQMACEDSGLIPAAGATCTAGTAADGFNAHSVQKFDSSGNLITTWGGTPAGGQLDGTTCSLPGHCRPRPHFERIEGVLVIPPLPPGPVKPEGSLLVLSSAEGEEATEWSQSSGEFVYKPGTSGAGAPIGIAVDPAGHVYVGEGTSSGFFGVIQTSYCDQEDPFGQCPGPNEGEGFGYHKNCNVDPGPATGVAVDPGTEDVYVARFEPSSHHSDVAGYDSLCNHLETFGGNGEITQAGGIAASGFSGAQNDVYVADVGANRVEVFAAGGPRDALTVARVGSGLGSVSSVPVGVISCPSLCSAGFPEGEVVTLTATAPEHSSFVGWSGGGCAGTGACQITFTAATAVTATFAYDRPVLSVAPAVAVTRHTATLAGTVNPEGDASSCFFEYGTTGAYGAQAPCSSHPGSGAGSVPVSAELWELATSTTYHYRLVSANSGGTSYGSDETFTTGSEGCASNDALCPALPAVAPIATAAVVPPKPPAPTTTRGTTNAQKLAKALKACKKQEQRSVRVKCEKQAQRRYAPAKKKPKKSTRSGKRG
jgi:NHL repeat/Divergent InlB B-repeat domain